MKPFYIYHVDGKFNIDQPIEVKPQVSMIEGIAREPRTYIKKSDDSFLRDFSLLSVNHDLKERQYGITTVHVNGEPKTVNFNDYLVPEKFNAFYSSESEIVIFQAAGATAKSAIKAINENTDKFELKEVPFNFSIANNYITEYKGAWFQDINANLSSIGMRGQDVQDDEYFEIMKQQGSFSNISFNFDYRHNKHQIMITKYSGVVLYNKYENIEIELDIVAKVFQQLIKKVWESDAGVGY